MLVLLILGHFNYIADFNTNFNKLTLENGKVQRD